MTPSFDTSPPVCGGPFDRGIQITHHLCIGHLVDDFGQQPRNLPIALRVALALEQLRRNRKIAGAGQTSGGVGDVLMNTKDLGDDQHHRQPGLARRGGPVGWHLEAIDVNDDFA